MEERIKEVPPTPEAISHAETLTEEERRRFEEIVRPLEELDPEDIAILETVAGSKEGNATDQGQAGAYVPDNPPVPPPAHPNGRPTPPKK